VTLEGFEVWSAAAKVSETIKSTIVDTSPETFFIQLLMVQIPSPDSGARFNNRKDSDVALTSQNTWVT
jgi:hypothetical protein